MAAGVHLAGERSRSVGTEILRVIIVAQPGKGPVIRHPRVFVFGRRPPAASPFHHLSEGGAVGSDVFESDGPVPDLVARDGVVGQLGFVHDPVVEHGFRDRPVRNTGGHDGVGDGGQPLPGLENRAVHLDLHPDFPVRQRVEQGAGYGVVPEKRGIQPVDDRHLAYVLVEHRSADGGGIEAQIHPHDVVHQDAAVDQPALVVDEQGNCGAGGKMNQAEQDDPSDKSASPLHVGPPFLCPPPPGGGADGCYGSIVM